MRHSALILLVVGFPVASSGAVPPASYVLVWSDEFGGNALDTRTWMDWGPYGGVRYAERIVNDNTVALSGGNLKLTTFRVPGTDTVQAPMISTMGVFKARGGYFEARFMQQHTGGGWSAFWFEPMYESGAVSDPFNYGAEIDVFELFSPPTGNVEHNVHWNGYGTYHQTTGNRIYSVLSSDLWGYHTVGMEWTPTEYVFYIDGVESWRTGMGVSGIEEYVILSMEVTLDRFNIIIQPDPNFSDSIYFDHVRVYQDPANSFHTHTWVYCGNGVVDAGEICDGNCPASCTDGNACTVDVMTGSAGNCNVECSHTPVTCTSDQCNTRTCNSTSTCTVTPKTGTACDDGADCTYDDVCNSFGVCTGGTTTTCTSDQCNTRTCNGSSTCTITPLTGTGCDDGKACTTGDQCQAGICIPTANNCSCNTDSDCFALDQCHVKGTCDLGSHLCSNPAKPDSALCDDGDLCTSSETCRTGVCGAPVTTVTCAAQDECHVAGVCDPASGSCSNPVRLNGSACSAGVCIDGLCAQTTDDGGHEALPDAPVLISGGCACRDASPGEGISGLIATAIAMLMIGRSRRRGIL